MYSSSVLEEYRGHVNKLWVEAESQSDLLYYTAIRALFRNEIERMEKAEQSERFWSALRKASFFILCGAAITVAIIKI